VISGTLAPKLRCIKIYFFILRAITADLKYKKNIFSQKNILIGSLKTLMKSLKTRSLIFKKQG
jgi:hypothetical protein